MNIAPLSNIAKAYSAILFLPSPVAGLAIMASTFVFPNIALAGLLGALVGLGVTRLWQLPDYGGQVQIFNSLLVGLSLGAFYQLNFYVVGLIVLGALLASLLATVLADWLWRLDRLPVLSLPFVIVAGIMALTARNYTELTDYLGLTQVSYTLITPSVDGFFSALGAIFFTPAPIVGLILFIALCFFSRYLGLLALIGYLTGYALITVLLFEPHPSFITWTGFNFILVAIALGGVFTIPSIAGLVLAIIGVLLTALLVIATKNLLLVEGLPVMAIAFVMTTLVIIMTMKKRLGLNKPYLAPEPGLPERNYERARLAKYRNGAIDSVPLLAPVFGRWTIYQGCNGRHTHKPPWQYALDFIISVKDKSFSNDGAQLEDYFCFSAPVLSPAYATVARTYDRLPDNNPGDVDATNNWGNFILLRLDSGLHVLLAHLQQASIKVKEGERVIPGKVLAACGNSGRSPQPHLHMQVQRSAELGSPTHPFHLSSILLHNTDNTAEYHVNTIPKDGEIIEATIPDDQLSNQLHLPVGRQFTYQLSAANNNQTTQHQLLVELTLLGQLRLVSDTHASAAFEEINGVLAFYDRKGPKDILLNMWLLAIGLTPLTEIARHWRDAPSATLLPLSLNQRSFLNLLHPMGSGLDSEYHRQWDQNQSAWVQCATHTLTLAGVKHHANTIAVIDPQHGCKSITLDFNDKQWRAELTEQGLIEDIGVPRWTQTVTLSAENNSNTGRNKNV